MSKLDTAMVTIIQTDPDHKFGYDLSMSKETPEYLEDMLEFLLAYLKASGFSYIDQLIAVSHKEQGEDKEWTTL